jgi:diaminopimelate decarboxylase
MKANPFAPVLETLREMGAGVDAASKGEVFAAAQMGFHPDDIYYSAPGKPPEDIAPCLSTSHIVADSVHELTLLDKIIGDMGFQMGVGIRLNIPQPALDGSHFEVMGGVTSKFGISETELADAAPLIRKMKNIKIDGLHVYFGSQIADAAVIAQNFEAISHAALKMRYPLEYINYGGGFGVPYSDGEAAPDIKAAGAAVAEGKYTRAVDEKGIQMNLELGRYLVARAGLFVTSVRDVKVAGGVTFVIVDGGMNAFFRPKFTGQAHKVSVLAKSGNEAPVPVRVVGNTCTPLDVCCDATLPLPGPGDVLVFEGAGAYGYTMSLLDFISLKKPEQVMVESWE